jgi:hypothetical protein
MSWEPGTLLGLRDTTQSYGKYPGDSVFVMLRSDRNTAGVIVLTPHGAQALIPPGYLVRVEDRHLIPGGQSCKPARDVV